MLANVPMMTRGIYILASDRLVAGSVLGSLVSSTTRPPDFKDSNWYVTRRTNA